MKILKELVFAINKKKLRPIETLNLEGDGDSVYRKFYYKIKFSEGEIDESNIAEELCNTNPSDKKYLMVKSRFRKRLINHLFFLDYSTNLNEHSKKITEAYKYVYLAKVLNLIGAKNTSTYLINKALPVLEKYEVLEVLITAFQLKINEYSFKNNFKKIDDYSKQLMHFLYLFENESKVYILFQKSGYVFSKAEILNEKDFQALEVYVNEIKILGQQKNISFKSSWFSLLVQVEFLEYIGAYDQVIEKCKKIETILNKNPQFKTNTRIVLTQTFLLEAYGKLNYLKEGEEIVTAIKDIYVETSFNWFHVQRKILFFYVNTKQYVKALEIVNHVVSSKAFKNYNPRFKELWILWQAFIKTILLKKGEVLKIEKVMNSVVSMTKDHLGVNTTRQVLEIFYKFLVGREEEIIDKTNILAINKSRYLKPNKLKRASLFYDFIIKSSKSGFQNVKMQKIGTKTLNDLLVLQNSNPEKRAYEIIPYEEIIEMMLAKKKVN